MGEVEECEKNLLVEKKKERKKQKENNAFVKGKTYLLIFGVLTENDE